MKNLLSDIKNQKQMRDLKNKDDELKNKNDELENKNKEIKYLKEIIIKLENKQDLMNQKQINDDREMKNLSFNIKSINPILKEPIKKLDPDEMVKMLDSNENPKIDENFKEYYENKAKKAHVIIKFLDKSISDDPKITNELKELYDLRKTYYLHKLNNDLEKNMFIDIFSINTRINKLQDELGHQKGKGIFTSQNEFVKLLILLTQLRTKTNSKMLKNEINRLLKELYNSKQITKQVHNNIIKAITYKNDL